MARKTSGTTGKVAKKAAVRGVAAKGDKAGKALAKTPARKATELAAKSTGAVADGTGTLRCRPTSRRCPVGSATSGAASTHTAPNVRKAVRWNSPFYGIEGQGWFLSFHCITKYIKVAFLNGASLRPLPPVESKHKETRYFHIYENDQLDEEFLASWIGQASELPGEKCF